MPTTVLIEDETVQRLSFCPIENLPELCRSMRSLLNTGRKQNTIFDVFFPQFDMSDGDNSCSCGSYDI